MSSDGTKVIVGARLEDTGASNAGKVYIYTYSSGSWGSEVMLQASDKQASDYFGYSVSMSGDGTRVIVGASIEDTGGSNAGKVYIYTYSSGSWGSEVMLQASDKQADDQFGHSVSMNSDGTKVIVGAMYEDTGGSDAGKVYIYTYSSGSWGSEVMLQASDKQASDNFGTSVSMSSDGTKVLVGAWKEDTGGSNAGSAYIFALSGGSWSQEAKIQASDAQVSDQFGVSVSMSSDGTRVIVGAGSEDTGGNNAGAAYIYEYVPNQVFDSATQVFTATGTGIVSGSTVQLEGADGSLYSVVDATAPNAVGTQVTFKMGSEAVEFPPSAMSTNTSITGYTASASMNSSTAWKAFDDVVTTGSYWTANPGNATVGYDSNSPYLAGLDSAATQDISGTTHRGHWIQLQIPNPVVLSRAVIGSTQAGYQHGQFVILGSNDNANWTLLHADQNLPTTLSTNVTTLSAGSTEAFSYFRVVIKSKGAGSSNYNIELNNVQFFGGSGSWVLANQPYKLKVSSTSGLIGTSTAAIGFAVGWTTAAGANLEFDISASTTHTLAGTDGGGGTNRTFSLAPGSNALPSGLTLTGGTGAITGTIAAVGTTSVTFRLTDNATGLFTDRAINIVGGEALYSFTSHTFTNAGKTGQYGPTLSQLTTAYSPTWTDYTSNLNVTTQGIQEWTVPSTGSYTIKAAGAGIVTASGDFGGVGRAFQGIEMQGTFTLSKGVTVRILVGQSGTYGTGNSPGGSGGTYVFYNATDTYPILVAGGGGGFEGSTGWRAAGIGTNTYLNSCGQSGTSGGANAGTSAGGTSGSGGGDVGSYAGGGAGWLTDGGDASSVAGSGGHAPRNTGAPGRGGNDGGSYTGFGGFGGGGGVHGNTGGAGAGGGYSGGKAQTQSTGGSGGGGSYGGTATNVYNTSQGYCIITQN
jgi:hypothetical protein